ncbi:hypothetical protein HDU67_001191 [Dinochytrium kinnereticum]|nr:hypothetical protein HDU67_001191 [Dinochytrium kinnereticum]
MRSPPQPLLPLSAAVSALHSSSHISSAKTPSLTATVTPSSTTSITALDNQIAKKGLSPTMNHHAPSSSPMGGLSTVSEGVGDATGLVATASSLSRETSSKIKSPSLKDSAPPSSRLHDLSLTSPGDFETQVTSASLISSPSEGVRSNPDSFDDLDEDLQAQIVTWIHVGRSLLKRVKAKRHASTTSSICEDSTVKLFVKMVAMFEAEAARTVSEEALADEGSVKIGAKTIKGTVTTTSVTEVVVSSDPRVSMAAEIVSTDGPSSSSQEPISALNELLNGPTKNAEKRDEIDRFLDDPNHPPLPASFLPAAASLGHARLLTYLLDSTPPPAQDYLKSALYSSASSGATDIIHAILLRTQVIVAEPAMPPKSGKIPASSSPSPHISAQHAAQALWSALRLGHVATARAIFHHMPAKAAGGVIGLEHVAHAAARGDCEALDWALLKRRRGCAGDTEALAAVMKHPEATAAFPRRGEADDITAAFLKLSTADWMALALVIATAGGFKDCVGSLLQAGASPKWRKGTPMVVAEREGRAEVIALMVQASKDQSAFSWSKGRGGSFGEATSPRWIDKILGGMRKGSKADIDQGSPSPKTSKKSLLKTSSFHGKWSKKEMRVDDEIPLSSPHIPTDGATSHSKKLQSTSSSAPNLIADSTSPHLARDVDARSVSAIESAKFEALISCQPIAKATSESIERVKPAEIAVEIQQSESSDLPGAIPSVVGTPVISRKERSSEEVLREDVAYTFSCEKADGMNAVVLGEKVDYGNDTASNESLKDEVTSPSHDKTDAVIDATSYTKIDTEKEDSLREKLDKDGAADSDAAVVVGISTPAIPVASISDAEAVTVTISDATKPIAAIAQADEEQPIIQASTGVIETVGEGVQPILEAHPRVDSQPITKKDISKQSPTSSPLSSNVPLPPPLPPPGAVKIKVSNEDVSTPLRSATGPKKSIESVVAARKPASTVSKKLREPTVLSTMPITVLSKIADHLGIHDIFNVCSASRSLHLNRSVYHARYLVRISSDGVTGAIRTLLSATRPKHFQDASSHDEKLLVNVLKVLNPAIADELQIAKGPSAGTTGFRSVRAGFIGNPGRRLGPRNLDPLLDLALSMGHSWAIGKLLVAGSTSKSSLSRFLGKCAESGDYIAVNAFLTAGADANTTMSFPSCIEFAGGSFDNVDGTCLAVAACFGHEATVTALLEAGADASLFDSLALRSCAGSSKGNGAVVARLLVGGADPGSHAYEAIRRAALRGSPEVLRVLVAVISGTVKAKWEVRSVIRVAYESAAKAGHAEAVGEMLKERATWIWGPGLEGPGSVLRPAVMAAILNRKVDVIRVFADSDAWGFVISGDDGKAIIDAALSSLPDDDAEGGLQHLKPKSTLIRSVNGSRVSLDIDRSSSNQPAKITIEGLSPDSDSSGLVDDSYDDSDPVAVVVSELIEAILAGAGKVGRARYPTAFYGGSESASTKTKIDPWELLRTSERIRKLRRLLLMQAAIQNHETVVDAVLSTLQPDIMRPLSKKTLPIGQRALCAAVSAGNAKMVARLISAGAEFMFEDGKLFRMAADAGHIEVLQFLTLSRELHIKAQSKAKERQLHKLKKENRVEPPL